MHAWEVKSTVVTEAAKTIDMVDEVRDSLAASKKEMASQLAVFKNQLSQLSSVSSDHDQDDIDALESGLYAQPPPSWNSHEFLMQIIDGSGGWTSDSVAQNKTCLMHCHCYILQ